MPTLREKLAKINPRADKRGYVPCRDKMSAAMQARTSNPVVSQTGVEKQIGGGCSGCKGVVYTQAEIAAATRRKEALLRSNIETINMNGLPASEQRRMTIGCLKNTGRGRRCFILATGPSVALQDISWLKDELVIGVNFAHKVTLKYGWTPTYLLTADRKVIVRLQDEYRQLADHPQHRRTRIVLTDTCMLDHKYNARNLVSGPGVSLKYAKDRFDFDCSTLIHVPVAYSSVGHLAIPWACYLGCTEIYLLGCDCTAGGHAYDDKGVVCPGAMGYWSEFFFPAMATIRRITERQGISIYNATKGGNLEVLVRVDLDSLRPNTIGDAHRG